MEVEEVEGVVENQCVWRIGVYLESVCMENQCVPRISVHGESSVCMENQCAWRISVYGESMCTPHADLVVYHVDFHGATSHMGIHVVIHVVFQRK